MIKDLSIGKPSRVLTVFALPMLLSVLFQQFYNMADNIVAGQFINDTALDAVSLSYPITMIYMAVALGINVGINVVVSQLFGARQIEKMKTAVSTSLIASVSLALTLTVFGLLLMPALLRALNTPDYLMEPTLRYLNIYTAGLFFIFLYNTSTGIFTALGDTVTPLVFLIISSLSNVGVNILFVTRLGMEVEGLALATLLCQGAAAIASFSVLLTRLRRLNSGKFALFSVPLLLTTASVSIPGIMQKSFVSVGNLLVQSIVNSYAATVPGIIGGFSSATKLLYIIVHLNGGVGSALASYVAQNIGAGKTERVKDGYRCGYILCLSFCVPATLFFLLAPRAAMGIFVPAESGDIISAGASFLLVSAPWLVVVALKQVCDGILHGAGSTREFTTTTFIDLAVRVVLAYLLPLWLGHLGIWWAWPIGWGVGTVVSVYFYYRGRWKNVHLLDHI